VGYLMDNASRVVLDAAVTGKCGRRAEMAQAIEGLKRVRWKYKLSPQTLGGDKGYAAGRFIRDVFETGTTPHVPVWDTRREHDRGIYTIERFTYDESADCFICPQGKILKHHGRNHKQVIYRAREKDCRACPVRSECTRDKARSVSFHIDGEYIERAKREMKTKGYRLSQRCRKKIEELFGEAKEQHGMRRMKFRGRAVVKEQVLLTAAVQNIKRLVKFLERRDPEPAEATRAGRATPKNRPLRAFARLTLTVFENLSRSLSLIVNSEPVPCL